jgi:hypothetical protein
MLHYLGVVEDGCEVVKANYTTNWDRNRSGEMIPVESFILDRHTRKGSSKTLTEFAEEGAFVENEFHFVNLIWKSFYEDGKRFEDGLPLLLGVTSDAEFEEFDHEEKKEDVQFDPCDVSDTTEYRFLVRTQLTTSSTKMDVYFARDVSDKLVVVKGPYENKEEVDIIVENTEWKKRNGIPFLPVTVREMLPDRWPEGVPLGAPEIR